MKMPFMVQCFLFVANKKTNMRDLPTPRSYGKPVARRALGGGRRHARSVLAFIAAFCAASAPGLAQTPPPDPATSPVVTQAPSPIPDTPYSVVEHGANYRIWQKFSYETTVDGDVVSRSHKYTELASGLHFKDAFGNWIESQEQIVPLLRLGAA